MYLSANVNINNTPSPKQKQHRLRVLNKTFQLTSIAARYCDDIQSETWIVRRQIIDLSGGFQL